VNDSNDDLTGIFDHLTWQDFAEGLEPIKDSFTQPAPPPENAVGSEAFGRFVEASISMYTDAYLAAAGNLDPIAILVSPEGRWTYLPTAEENVQEWLDRISAEAKKRKATWFFVARKTLVGNYQASTEDEIPDATQDEAKIEWAIKQGYIAEGVFFFAKRIEGEDIESKHGILKDRGGQLTGRVDGSNEHQTVNLFDAVLG
jgi:hypothetical protein